MQRVWRIKDLLEWTTRYFLDRGIMESRLEAEILLAHVVQKDRVYLYANYEEPINTEEREIYREYIKRRINGEPLAYITGHKEFMSLDFKVSPDVLIPRPDTEVLVETALAIASSESVKRVIDVGTGSGAIAVSLAVYLDEAEVYATDISPRALGIARENAQANHVEIRFVEGDLLTPFLVSVSLGEEQPGMAKLCEYSPDSLRLSNLENESKKLPEKSPSILFDMITANLPYIPAIDREQLDRQVKDFEPHLALFAAGDGLELYRRLIPQAYTFLRPEGVLLMEIDSRQAHTVPDIMPGFTDIKIIKDLAGRDRVVQARRENND